MILSDISIKRPVFATVLNLLIIVFGLYALSGLPVREYPDIDAPVVSVSTSYTGASSQVMDNQITQIIESSISGIEGVRIIESSSGQGSSRTSIEFETTRDIEVAANDVRDAVSRVAGSLPDEADAPVIRKANSDARPMMWITLESDSWDSSELSDFADRVLKDRLSILDGISDVRIGGDRRYAMRVWLDNARLAAHGLTISDVESALRNNNVELPAGKIESDVRNFNIRAEGRLSKPEEFKQLALATSPQGTIRLGQVADVVIGVESDKTRLRANGKTAIGLGIIRQSKANTVAVSDLVKQEVEKVQQTLPSDIKMTIAYDESIFIRSSIKEVLTTLAISIALVVLVIFVFLRSWRATLIPAVTIPVAVIGAFIGLGALGFSINVLTLLAVILAIGLVVDDAIVVLENVQRRLDQGETPLVAAYYGTRQVAFAVVATTITLVAVFVPISFMGGNVGRLFSEFGFTLAAAVIVSSFVALTLTAMLSSKWLKASKSDEAAKGVWGVTERFFDGLTKGYRYLLHTSIQHQGAVLGVALSALILAGFIFPKLSQELSPAEDRGAIIIPVSAPIGSSAEYTDSFVRQIEGSIQEYLDKGTVEASLAIVAFRGSEDGAFIIMRLQHWDERTTSQKDILGQLRKTLGGITGVKAFAIAPGGLGQRGFSQPLQVVVGGPDYELIQVWSDRLLEKAKENPNIYNLDTNFKVTQPEVRVRIDREKASDLGISVRDIGVTLQTMMASRVVTSYMDRGEEYDVVLQGRAIDRKTPEDILEVFVRSTTSGELIPLKSIVTVETVGASPSLNRVDRLPSVVVSGSLAEGYDMGSAVAYINSIAAEVLPPEARISYQGTSREMQESSASIYITFAIAFVVIFLVLAAQFESWIHPGIIMLSVPLAITGALAALLISGISMNIYSQIGIIMLLGLMAKNGILIVEFANQLRDEGYNVKDAIIEGSIIRFRPILMTTISTICGAIPLILSSGAGAESREAIGTVIVGGLLFATIMTLFVIPVLYNLLAGFTQSSNAIEHALEREAGKATETK